MINGPKNALVIGNGFDLNLGLETKFSNFANAKDYWPEKDGSKLSIYLDSKKSIEKWFDLEGALREYATGGKNSFETINAKNKEEMTADFAYFEKLRIGLMGYLAEEEKKEIIGNSVAARVIKGVSENSNFESVYTLNYTDLNGIARKLGINNSGKIHYLHGSLANKDIIIGIDDIRLNDEYKNWRKARSEYYKPHNIFADLDASKEVVFFGLSFGWIDYKYFKQFFAKVSTPVEKPIQEKNRKFVTIFTYDENDRRSIMDFLERMKVDLDFLYSQTNFEIIRTKDNQDNKKVESFLARLRKDRPAPLVTPSGY